MDLWGYRKDAIEREARKLYPDAVEVTLFSGLYASVRLRSGEWVTVNEFRLALGVKDVAR